MFATTTPESTDATTRSISSSGPKTAARAPLSATSIEAISCPLALTASRAAAKVIAPAATSAPYSPRLWPMTMSGRKSYASRSRVRARSAVRIAGCVISVRVSCCSSSRTASGSLSSMKMYDVSGRPSTRRHDPVRLRERVGHDRDRGAEVCEHVDVLRALSGVEEGDLRGRSAADEDTLGAQHLPQRRGSGPERLGRLARLGREIGGVRVVEGDPDGCAGGSRDPGRRRVASSRPRRPRRASRPVRGRRRHRVRRGPPHHAVVPASGRPGVSRQSPWSRGLSARRPRRTCGARTRRDGGRGRSPRAPRGSWYHRSRTH